MSPFDTLSFVNERDWRIEKPRFGSDFVALCRRHRIHLAVCAEKGVRSIALIYRSVNDLIAAEMMEADGDGRINRVCAHYGNEIS